jgi:hypothetical protein
MSATVLEPDVGVLEPLRRVSVAPFRDRMLELERTGRASRTDVARRLGWYRRPAPGKRAHGLIPDTGRVSRVLGLKGTQPQRCMSYETGVRFCHVLDLDPIDAGV